MTNNKQLTDQSAACLLAGAAGDALGAPVEFMNLPAIRSRFGVRGIRDYVPAYGGPGKITDDTQMTLFTAEGCLRSLHHARTTGLDHSEQIIRAAYLRWLETQSTAASSRKGQTSFLMQQTALFSRRAPGNTCLSALGQPGGEHARTQVAGRMAMGEPGTLQAEQESRPRLADMDDPARRHPHDAAAALAVIAFAARPAECT